MGYTREAGVRNLEREIAKLARKAVTQILKKKTTRVDVDEAVVEEYLGVRRHRFGLAETEDQVGVVTGLAWTSVGGELLHIEALKLPGKGRMKTTGKLGDVMKESVGVARSYIRAAATDLGIDPDVFENTDVHVHVPSGAIPKDGPSAGVTMLTAMVSLLLGLPVDPTVAMTGEATLRGAVLPVGGVKEKVLAAHRAGIRTVLLPEKCKKDLVEVPKEIRDDMTFHFCSRMEEVLNLALGEDKINERKAALQLELARRPLKAAVPPEAQA